MQKLFLLLLIAFTVPSISAQEIPIKEEAEINLVNWSFTECDHTYDPYRIENRITHIDTKGEI